MKNRVEAVLLWSQLQRKAEPGSVLANLKLDLPNSNYQVSLCIYQRSTSQRPVAMLQTGYQGWTYEDPPEPEYGILVPVHIYKYVRRRLRQWGIADVIGILPNDRLTIEKCPSGMLVN